MEGLVITLIVVMIIQTTLYIIVTVRDMVVNKNIKEKEMSLRKSQKEYVAAKEKYESVINELANKLCVLTDFEKTSLFATPKKEQNNNISNGAVQKTGKTSNVDNGYVVYNIKRKPRNK